MTFAIAPETVAAMANLGLPVTADNWVHGLAEHIKRDAQCDIEEILLCEHMGFGIDRAAEKCKDRLAEDQVNSGQDNTAGNTENDRVANGFMCVLLGIASQRNTDKGTAARHQQERRRQAQLRSEEIRLYWPHCHRSQDSWRWR